jgi:KDO2-lipid IV(A) lauroyltransferase
VPLLIGLLRLLACLPLRGYHAIGSALGFIAYLTSRRYASRMRDNLRASGVWRDEADYRRILRANIAEVGKGALEIIPIWFRGSARAAELVRSCRGQEAVLAAHRSGRGIVLLTPHLGCFEISAIYASRFFPITVLYRQPHIRWLDRLIVEGRGKGQEKLAPADVRGVRRLVKALKAGEAVGVLPDQAPGAGEGVWVEYFGRPAYTMTLIGRMTELTDPAVFVAVARRLPRGRGYEIDVRPVEGDLTGVAGARRMNAAIEEAVRTCPEQYLWSYNRYKHPAGAPLPPSAAAPRAPG